MTKADLFEIPEQLREAAEEMVDISVGKNGGKMWELYGT